MKRKLSEINKIFDSILGDNECTPLIASAIRFFMRNPFESLVIVDKEGYIEFMDRGSERFFGLPKGGAKGAFITDLIEDSLILKALKTKSPIIGEVFDINKKRRIISTYPLIRDGEVVGAIGHIILSSLDEIERINGRIKFLKSQIKSMRQREKQQYQALYTFDRILGISENIKECIDLAKKVATTGSDVLIVGESGTGKELFAQSIHNYTNPDRPFISVNSPAIPFDLAESELFGYKKGAFSGAKSEGKLGKFELANHGTLFLDEIPSLPLSIQSKLLRILQEREIQPLGDTRTRKVDFTLISSANIDLKKLVDDSKFRMDLYYRIAKITININPLRKRKDDIPILIRHFFTAINRRFGTNFKQVSDEVLSCFMNHSWPGNVRELINVLEQACMKKWQGQEITMASLPPEFYETEIKPGTGSLGRFKDKKREAEKEVILQALEETKGNKRQAAKHLNISRSSLYNKIKEFKIETS